MKKLTAILLSLVMVISMMPVVAFAAEDQAETKEIDYGTPGEDYEAGEVIVCVRGGAKALSEATSSINVDETLFSFKSTESKVEQAAAVSHNDEEALVEAVATEESTEESQEKYSLVLVTTSKKDVTSLIEKLEALDCVMFAEPNTICQPTLFNLDNAKDETGYDYQWYLDKDATNVENDIDAENAYSNGAFADQEDVVVAVMDTGVDYNHPDLQGVMLSGYGINTSGEGGPYDPMDTAIGHGTHCASTIASSWSNNKGVAGINPNAKIMACKWMSAQGGSISNYITAMKYVINAKKRGVNVVATNNSWGPGSTESFCGGVTDVIANEAGELGIVSCFAAGNDEADHDAYTNLTYASPYIVTVGAMQSNGTAAYFSERGKRTVDVFAPGAQILAATSTYNKNTSPVDMAPQYLPWIQEDSDSIVYEDFEDGTDDATISANNITKGTDITISNRDKGYNSSKAKSIKLDGLSDGDSIRVDLTIPVETLDSDFYLSFAAGIKGATLTDYYTGRDDFGLVLYYDKNESIDYLSGKDGYKTYWRATDKNWSIYSSSVSNSIQSTIKERISSGKKNVKLRMAFKVKGTPSSGAELYIDNIGIGNKASDYYYSDGTSMATPCTAGVASLIAGTFDGGTDSGSDAKNIIARLKGGVKVTGGLDDVCTTKGCVQASSAFKSESELNPVPDSVTLNADGTATIDGHFFGSTRGTGSVTVAGKLATVKSWSNNRIKITVPSGTNTDMLEYTVKRNDNKEGREFAVFKEDKTGEATGYEEILTANFEYTVEGVKETSKDLIPVRIAANDDGIMAMLIDADEEMMAFEFYSFKTGKWTKFDNIKEDLYPKNSTAYNSMTGIGHTIYAECLDESTSHSVLLTFDTSKDSSNGNPKVQKSYGVNYNTLAVDCSGMLFTALGPNSDARISRYFPNTLFEYITSENMGNQFKNTFGGIYLRSGKTEAIIDPCEFEDEDGDGEYDSYGFSYPFVKKSGRWTKLDEDIWVKTTTEEQNYKAAYGVTDTGFIIAGPAEKIGKTGMADTWSYDINSGTYTKLNARVDAAKLSAASGVCHKGKFYVMGRSNSKGNKLFLKYLNLTNYGLNSNIHDLRHIDEQAATFKENGCKEYWICGDCFKKFSDKYGNNEVELDSLVIPKLVPSKTYIRKLYRKSKAIKVSISKQTKNTTGYQVRASRYSSMKSAKYVKTSKNSTTSVTIKKLKRKKKYYVQVRTYKKYDGKTYYSAWSSKKSIKTK